MSKELTAYPTLDSLVEETINRNIKAKDSQEHYECVEHDKIKASFFKDDVDYYSQVETALKRLGNYEKNEDFSKDVLAYAYLSEEEKIKKLKAFTLLDDCDIDIWLLKHCDYENYCRVRKLCLEATGNADIDDAGKEVINLPTPEEYELLKEILQ